MNRFEKVSYNQYLEAIGGDIDLFDEYNDIIIPKRATTGSAGYDFFAPFTFFRWEKHKRFPPLYYTIYNSFKYS